MSDDPEAAAIARKLTPTQRVALLWLPADEYAARYQGRAGDPRYGSLAALFARRLVDYRSGWWNLTPLGLRVRAALLAMEAGDG